MGSKSIQYGVGILNKSLFSSTTGEWETPMDFFNKLDSEFHFTLDPCATHRNAKCKIYFTKQEDGLIQDWSGHTVFVNPPYGRVIGKWVKKSYEEGQKTTVVMLIPARTDTKWWHDYVMKAAEIRFVKGRLKFGGSKNSAPFPSAIVVFKKHDRDYPLVRSVNNV